MTAAAGGARVGMMYATLPIPDKSSILLLHYGDVGPEVTPALDGHRVQRLDFRQFAGEDGRLREKLHSEKFDAILLHDVIDHLGMNSRQACALLLQLSSGLKPGGLMSWAAKNRFDRERLRNLFTSGEKKAFGGFFRHRNMARTIGLQQVGMALVLPDLNEPEAMISPDKQGARAYYGRLFSSYEKNYGFFKKCAARIILGLNLSPYLAPAFLIWGRK